MRKIYYLLVILLVIFNLFSVYRYIPKEDNFAKGADEGRYFTYSKYISENGIKSYPKLFKEHIENKENWIWPSPLRIGYFLLTSFWFKLFGSSFGSLAKFSFFCHILFLLICLYFSKRFFGKEISSLLVLLLTFSPLAMAMAKRALSDSTGNLFTIFSIWLFLHFLSEKKLFNFILFLIFYVYSILIREQSILVILFFGIYFLIYKYIYKANIPMNYFPMIIVMPICIASLIWLVSSQSFTNLITMIKLTRTLPAINEYSVLFCRGPWFRYIIDYLLISPLTTILALVFIVYTLINREIFEDYKISYFIILFVILYLLLSSFDYNKNIRYAMSLDMIIRLFVIFILKEIFKKSNFMGDFVFFIILFLCLIDYFNFIDLFCQKNIYDPVSFSLLKARRFIP